MNKTRNKLRAKPGTSYTMHLRDLCDSYVTLKYQWVGKLGRSVELQQHTRSKPEDEKIQLNPLNITVPDHLILLSRNEINNRTARAALIHLKRSDFLTLVGERSGKLVKFQNHTPRKPEDKKTELICLVFHYQTI